MAQPIRRPMAQPMGRPDGASYGAVRVPRRNIWARMAWPSPSSSLPPSAADARAPHPQPFWRMPARKRANVEVCPGPYGYRPPQPWCTPIGRSLVMATLRAELELAADRGAESCDEAGT
eukprot:4998712-Pyramimonas_sp.AAC.1